MAEEVIIQGFGNGGTMPDFATEATLKGLVSALQTGLSDVGKKIAVGGANGLKPADIEKLAQAIAKGDTESIKTFKDLINTNETTSAKTSEKLEKQLKALRDIKEENKKGNTTDAKDAKELQSSMDSLKNIMSEIRTGIAEGQLSMSEAGGSLVDTISTAFSAVTKGPLGKIADGLVKAAAAIKGANDFFIQIGEDRYNLANEIRQSGLATSLSDTQSGLVGFAEMVNRTSFTLGQAAEFASKFSAAVGDAGIERSMQFVEDMAYGGAEGANMMQRFGLEFGGVANMAGQYLDTVRNLGMLDRMNNQQLRSGMEDFMDTVTVTSNIMKVNIQDAAEMIANTLNQRDDLVAMMATLPEDMRTQVTSVVGAMGAQGTVVEEALAQFLSAGSMDQFLTTQTAQEMMGSQFGIDLIPLIESMGTQIQMGGDLGQIIASSTSSLESILNSAQESGRREQIIQSDDQFAVRLIAQLSRQMGRYQDANAGNRADLTRPELGDDLAFNERSMVQQEFNLALENMTTALANQSNYAKNLHELNEANLGLIDQIEVTAVGAINEFGDEVAAVTFNAEEWVKEIGAGVTAVANELLSFVSEDFAETRRIVQEQNRRARETLGLPVAPTPAQQAEIDAQNEQEIRQREEAADFQRMQNQYSAGIYGTQVPEEYRRQVEFDEDTARRILEQGNMYQGPELVLNPNIQLEPMFDPTLYMELPPEFISQWNSEIQTLNTNNSVLEAFLERNSNAEDGEVNPNIIVTTDVDTSQISDILSAYISGNTEILNNIPAELADNVRTIGDNVIAERGTGNVQINEMGAIDIDELVSGLSDSLRQEVVVPTLPEQLQIPTMSVEERTKYVDQSFITSAMNALTGSENQMRDFIQELGLMNKGLSFDLENEGSQARIQEFYEMAAEMQRRGTLESDRMERLLAAIESSNTESYWTQRNRTNEGADKERLITTMQQLIQALNS